MKISITRIGMFVLMSGLGLSSVYASEDAPVEIKSRADSEIKGDESYPLNASGSYDGTPGWQVKPPKGSGVSGLNRNKVQDAGYYEDCYPEGLRAECDPGLSDPERAGGNRNYDNDARYYGNDCYPGESESECRARKGQNTNYRNNAQYYGECNPEEEKCKKKGANRNYQLNMDDFSGERSDLYSGIPGDKHNNPGNFRGSHNSDLYRDIPGGYSDKTEIKTSNGQSWYQSDSGSDSGSGNYKYGLVDPNGSFSGYGGNPSDWDAIDNKRAEFDKGLDQEFNEEGLYKDKEETNWMTTLVFCHLQIPFEGVREVFGDKTCRKSVRKLCRFKVSRMKIYGPSQCGSFAPWKM